MIVSFQTAKSLKDAGFPQPKNINLGQSWYLPSGELIFITKEGHINGKPLWEILVFHAPSTGTEYFAPNRDEIFAEMPEAQNWGIGVNELGSLSCISDNFPGVRFDDLEEHEAYAKAWIYTSGKNWIDTKTDNDKLQLQ